MDRLGFKTAIKYQGQGHTNQKQNQKWSLLLISIHVPLEKKYVQYIEYIKQANKIHPNIFT